MELMTCSGLVVGTTDKNCLFTDLIWYYQWYEILTNCLYYTSAVSQPFLLLIAANLALAGCLGRNGAYGLCRLGCRYNGAKLSFSWPYMIVSMIWNTSKMSALHLSRATAIFVVDCCQFGPSWMFILSMIWNTSKLSTSHRILPWYVFTHMKKVCLRYNLQYTKFIPCTKNIWIIFEYHDDNYEWIFIHQIFLELVP